MNISNSQTIIYSLAYEKRKRKRKLSNDSTGIIICLGTYAKASSSLESWSKSSRNPSCSAWRACISVADSYPKSGSCPTLLPGSLWPMTPSSLCAPTSNASYCSTSSSWKSSSSLSPSLSLSSMLRRKRSFRRELWFYCVKKIWWEK